MTEFNLREKRKELFETMKLVMMKGVARDIRDRIIFQDKEFIMLLRKELGKLTNIVYGNSPDTYNLNGFKGLIKNQLLLLERSFDKLAGDYKEKSE